MTFLTQLLYWLASKAEDSEHWLRMKAFDLEHPNFGQGVGTATDTSASAVLIPELYERRVKEEMLKRMALFEMVERIGDA